MQIPKAASRNTLVRTASGYPVANGNIGAAGQKTETTQVANVSILKSANATSCGSSERTLTTNRRLRSPGVHASQDVPPSRQYRCSNKVRNLTKGGSLLQSFVRTRRQRSQCFGSASPHLPNSPFETSSLATGPFLIALSTSVQRNFIFT